MLTIENAPSRAAEFIASIPPYPGHFRNRGIVTCAGGVKYLTCAWVQIAMLRRLGCTLPIEVWYLGEEERDVQWIELVRPFGVDFVNAFDVRQRHPHPRLCGWEAKAYTILHSRFQEVLFLDADNVPVVDPTFLFATPAYRETGAVFWPDAVMMAEECQAWRVFDVAFRSERAFESGQILIDKERCWRPLQLCNWYNEHSDFFYEFVHGDKETFHFAWHRLEHAFTLVPFPPEAGTFGVIQFDLDGKRLFQHRIRDKWSLAGNRRDPHFWHEETCLALVRQLADGWDPVIHLTRRLTMNDRLEMESLAEKTYRFIVVGGRNWPIHLRAEGGIGVNSRAHAPRDDPPEQFWWCFGSKLILAGADGRTTAVLEKQADGNWLGRSSARGDAPVRLARERRWLGPPLEARISRSPVADEPSPQMPEISAFVWPGLAVSQANAETTSTVIDLSGRCFNPSIVRHQGRLLCAYRNLLSDSENCIHAVYLNANLQPEGDSKRLEIPPALPLPSCWEDPRLFYFQERLFCSFTYWVPSLGSNRTAVGVCELGPNLEVKGARYPCYGFNHNACTGGFAKGQEKNWVFFEDGGCMFFIYDTVPFEVVAYDYDSDTIDWTMRTYPRSEWLWGKIRGGTPPLRLGDAYFSFFHSSLQSEGRWTYYAGILTFDFTYAVSSTGKPTTTGN